MSTASELMTPNPITVKADTSLADCARRMHDHRVRHLPVVDSNGAIAGLVTDGMVFQLGALAGARHELWVAFDVSDKRTTAGGVMGDVDVLAHEDDELARVLARVVHSVQDVAMVVDDNKRPLGILTEHDGVMLAVDLIPPELVVDHESSNPVHSVTLDSPAAHAYDLMLAHQTRHVVVTEDGKPAGVLSYSDLIEESIHTGRKLTAEQVLRRTHVITVQQGSPMVEAAKLMAEHKIGCVPVIDEDGRLVGVLTRTDILEGAVAALDREDLFPST